MTDQEREEQFNKIYESEYRLVRFICRRHIRDEGQVEDATQDALLNIFRSLHTYRAERNSSLRRWLCVVTRNTCYSRITRKKYRGHFLEIPKEKMPLLLDERKSALNILIEKERKEKLNDLMLMLTDRAADMVDLYISEHGTITEIAKQFHISRQRANKILNVAFDQMKTAYQRSENAA